MAVELTYLSDGGCSLEFDTSDATVVVKAVRRLYGKLVVVRSYGPGATIRFGGCEFHYHDEWDDPCIISSSPEGEKILKALCDTLIAKP